MDKNTLTSILQYLSFFHIIHYNRNHFMCDKLIQILTSLYQIGWDVSPSHCGTWLWVLTLHAVKCNLTELTTKSACVSLVGSGVDTYELALEFHALLDRSVVYRRRILKFLLMWQLITLAVLLPPLSLLLSTVLTVWQVPVPVTAWGFIAGLAGFASHGTSHLGAGCHL